MKRCAPCCYGRSGGGMLTRTGEQISESVLRLMRSAPHFWAPFFHWQALLLHKVRTTRHTAHARTAHA